MLNLSSALTGVEVAHTVLILDCTGSGVDSQICQNNCSAAWKARAAIVEAIHLWGHRPEYCGARFVTRVDKYSFKYPLREPEFYRAVQSHAEIAAPAHPQEKLKDVLDRELVEATSMTLELDCHNYVEAKAAFEAKERISEVIAPAKVKLRSLKLAITVQGKPFAAHCYLLRDRR